MSISVVGDLEGVVMMVWNGSGHVVTSSFYDNELRTW